MIPIIKELDPLFNPQSVAVIGATNNWNKWGFSTFSCVLDGYKGSIYPINLKEDKIQGHKAYKSVLDVQGDIDLAIFVIPAEKIPAIMKECVQKKVKAAVIISAGFRETGAEGIKLENEVLSIARKGKIRFVGPNCMGMWSASSNLRAYMFPLPAKDGPLAFVTQGGNVGGAIAMSANDRGLGLHRYVSCGPAADIQIEDYIEYFGEEDSVKVIATYIEGLEDGKRFIEKVSKVTKKKPVIVFKPGRTAAGAKAILSHSGALAGSDEIYDIAFKKAGVIRTYSPEELLDVCIGFLTQPLPSGRNVAIITGGGSYGVICAEYCATLGLNVVDLPKETIDDLSKIFPPRWSHGNPIDPAGDRNFISYYLAPEMILKLDVIDSLIFMGFGSVSGFTDMFLTSGSKMLNNPGALSSFASMKGLVDIVDNMASVIRSGDEDQIANIIGPFKPILASFFGSDAKTTEQFLSLIISGELARNALADIISNIPKLLNNISAGAESLRNIFSEFLKGLDVLVSSLILNFLNTFEKPIISTTFSEIPAKLNRGLHPYPTAGKAAFVMSKLVEYREYLEKVNAYEDPFKFCYLLNLEIK